MQRSIWSGFLILAFLFIWSNPVWAADLVMDGQFADWEGQANLTDPVDMDKDNGDIVQFSWANDNDNNLYFYIKRLESPQPENFEIYIDLDNNGSYSDETDALIRVFYHPKQDKEVKVVVNQYHNNYHYSGPWGASAEEGGQELEFSIPAGALALSPGQSLRMFVASTHDRLPDNGDILWSPIPIMAKSTLFMAGAGVLALLAWSLKRKTRI